MNEIIKLISSQLPDDQLKEQLSNFHEKDIAEIIPELNDSQRKYLLHALGYEQMAEIFAYLDDAPFYLEKLDIEEAADILEQMDADDAVDVLENISEDIRNNLISKMEEDAKHDIQLIYSYDDDEIGSAMTTNYIVIPYKSTVKQAMRSLIYQAEENDNINTLYVENYDRTYYGAIDLKDLITARDYTDFNSLISTSYPYVFAHEKIANSIERLKSYKEDSIPVLDDNHKIIGVITATDITEAVDDELGEDYAKFAGLTAEEDLKEKLADSLKKRMPWLILLLFLGMGVSSVVGIFEGIVSQIALIVCFQSLILDMAGNVGTQSLAVTIRVLMDENISAKQKIGFVFKEMRIGFLNGAILGILAFFTIGIFVHIAKHRTLLYSFAISGCVSLSLVTAMVISSLVGTLVPMFFHKIKIDPAVASGPLITTVNDLVAVITYYSLSGIILLRIFHLS